MNVQTNVQFIIAMKMMNIILLYFCYVVTYNCNRNAGTKS